MRAAAILTAFMLLADACSPQVQTTGTNAPAATTSPRSSVAATPTPVPTPPKFARVSMGDNFFAPDEVIVAAGAMVSWEIISGDAKHDVISADGFFRSNSPMNRGDIFSFQFTKPGEYAYICSYHTVEHMQGKIVVK